LTIKALGQESTLKEEHIFLGVWGCTKLNSLRLIEIKQAADSCKTAVSEALKLSTLMVGYQTILQHGFLCVYTGFED
jgi:hypothetical protein